MARIFIAYAREYQLFAMQLARSLSEIGAEIWIGVENIPAGTKWHNAIQEGLNRCELMLVIITPESMSSPNVEAEWSYFLDKKKPIIPILHKPADANYRIATLQYIDFHTQAYNTAFQQLHAELLRKGLQLAPLTPSLSDVRIPTQPKLPVKGRRQVPWHNIVWVLLVPLTITIIGVILATLIENPPAFLTGQSLASLATPTATQTQQDAQLQTLPLTPENNPIDGVSLYTQVIVDITRFRAASRRVVTDPIFNLSQPMLGFALGAEFIPCRLPPYPPAT